MPTGKRLEVRDIYLPGLVLRVSKTGAKVWYATPQVDGRSKRIKIGTCPVLSLQDARDKARDLLKDAQLGLLTETVIKAEAAKQATLGEVIPQFIDLYAKPRNRDWKETQSAFDLSITKSLALQTVSTRITWFHSSNHSTDTPATPSP